MHHKTMLLLLMGMAMARECFLYLKAQKSCHYLNYFCKINDGGKVTKVVYGRTSASNL